MLVGDGDQINGWSLIRVGPISVQWPFNLITAGRCHFLLSL